VPAISRRTVDLVSRFVDRINGLFGYQTDDKDATGRKVPAKSGHEIAIMFSMASGLYDRIKTEMDRLITLDDINRMVEEDAFVAGTLEKFIALVTNYEPRVTFTGIRMKEAQEATDRLLFDRLDYLGMRSDALWRLVCWGDLFWQRELIVDPAVAGDLSSKGSQALVEQVIKGRPIGFVAGILDLPAHAMFRNSDTRDRFPDPAIAFTQVPEGVGRYMDARTAPGAVNLPLYAIEHARWAPRRQRQSRYGRPALKSLRGQYNKLEVGKFDLLLARHTSSTQKLAFYLNSNVPTGSAPGHGISEEDLAAFYDQVLKPKRGEFTEISPDTNFILPGQHRVEAVGSSGQFSMSVPEDLYLSLEVEMQGFFCHPRLFGYQHGSSTSGDALKVMLWMADIFGEEVRRQEWSQMLRPLVLWNLWLQGIFTATPVIEWAPRRVPIDLAQVAATVPSNNSGTPAVGAPAK